MAKNKKAGISKAQSIRDYLAKNPDAMPRATVDALAKEGITVTTQDVSVVKHKLKATGGSTAAPAPSGPAPMPSRPAPKPSRKAANPSRKTAGNVTFADLQQAKAMARDLGGVDKAKKALEALSELLD